MWFQNRRAKWRKLDQTKKGPGRPAHNAHPQSCSGDPLSPEELVKREIQRRERKIKRQLEKQQAKLAAKGIHMDLASLRKQWELRQSREDGDDTESLIDVVGDSDDEDDEDLNDNQDVQAEQIPQPAPIYKNTSSKKSSFSIDSLLYSREKSIPKD